MSETLDTGPLSLSRRRALKLLASNIALISAACGKPMEEIHPYVRMPERVLPGVPLEFATTLPLGGYGRGVVCTSVEGRPIKVSGNPLHPASFGATDVFAEAHVLSLYDPARSQACRRNGEIASSVELETVLATEVEKAKASQGAGLRLLTGPISSPTLLRQIGDLKRQYPKLRWHVHDPLANRAARAGSEMAFGRPLRVLPRLAEAEVVVTFDADPLGPGPWQIVNARGFADRRRVRHGTATMSRLYAFESSPTQTGMKADHRIQLTPDVIGRVAVSLARALGADLPDPALDATLSAKVAAVAADLKAHEGKAIILVGPTQAPEIHAIGAWLNQRLKGAVAWLTDDDAGAETVDLLLRDLEAGRVGTLLISGTNPAYDLPPDRRFAKLLKKAPLTIHHGLYRDETAMLSAWHVPEPHPLEAWGDLRSLDGTPSLIQPLLEPLYTTRSLSRLLSFLAGGRDTDDYNTVRATWQAKGGNDFDAYWRKALRDGVLPDDKAASIDPGPARLPTMPAVGPTPRLTLVLAPDATLYDGVFAGNAWLQECPKPLTKEVWGNSLGLAPADAARLGLADGDTAGVKAGDYEIMVPVRVGALQAEGVASLALGHGRSEAGVIGSGVGANAYLLRSADGRWRIDDVAIRKAAGKTALSTQSQFVIDGDREDIFPSYAIGHLPSATDDKPKPNFLPKPDEAAAFARWAMVIDNASCIGCNACVVACQVENNVPVVGPDEIARHRDMHWLRIDAYEIDGSRLGFEPVPCMHCETAPCEPVCPVGASIHDSEGLNVQVYNRCIGTRFCEANCPYKVRRFNFFGYADGQTYGDLGEPVMAAHNNPNVTVRARGVMEKCTYCVQRISQARRTAEKENRGLRDGEVTTACQNACPTQAIAFGDLDEAGSGVVALRKEPQHFNLLAKLNTLPRTTYLADIRNPNPEFEEKRG